jgi:uncharacterized DUF497 family protein
MNVVFDPAKDAMNIEKHGISLSRANDFELIAYHPMQNDATTAISNADMKKVITISGREAEVIDFTKLVVSDGAAADPAVGALDQPAAALWRARAGVDRLVLCACPGLRGLRLAGGPGRWCPASPRESRSPAARSQ